MKTFFSVVNKILLHGYALVLIYLTLAFYSNTIAYRNIMIQIENVQASAILVLVQKMTGA